MQTGDDLYGFDTISTQRKKLIVDAEGRQTQYLLPDIGQEFLRLAARRHCPGLRYLLIRSG